MDRAYASGAAGSAPTPPASPSMGYPTSGNPATATPATKPGEWWYHMVTEEIRAVIVAAGLAPDHEDLGQLLESIEFLISEAIPGTPPAASEEVAGVVELATPTEVRDGADPGRAVTPVTFRAGLNAAGNAPVFACRGWGNINTVGTMTVKSGGNVLGVTDHGTGDFTATMTTALPHENYAVVFGSSGYADNGQTLYVPALKPAAGSSAQPPVLKTTTAFRVMIGQGYGAAYHDVPDVSFAVFC